MTPDISIFAIGASAFGLVTAFSFYYFIAKQESGTEKMRDISEEIRMGCFTFLKAQYSKLAIFVIILAALLAFGIKIETALAFVLGAVTSCSASFFGIFGTTKGNVRTVVAAKKSGISSALLMAFRSSSIMGLSVASLGLLGVATIYYFFNSNPSFVSIISGFSMGASISALFARVGGGIFTKAADVGSDLAGRLESKLAGDDPRNPGVIADNVGDNIGDVAGMGADIFESYVSSIIAALCLATTLSATQGLTNLASVISTPMLVALPFAVTIIGLAASIIGIFSMSLFKNFLPSRALISAEVLTNIIYLVACTYFTIQFGYEWNILGTIVAGTVAGFLIGRWTVYYTNSRPVRRIAEASKTGAATNVMTGFGIGLESCAGPLILITATIWFAFSFAGLFGLALSAVSLLATVGFSMSIYAFGPVADNAVGISEMSRQDTEVRKIADKLDSLGNTTAAVGRGYSIGSAALTSLALFVAFKQVYYIKTSQELKLDITNPIVIIGFLLGATVVLITAALTMGSVVKVATQMVAEIRRQFKEIPGLIQGTGKPDTSSCVEITTNLSLKEMIAPVLMSVVAPVTVGLAFGAEALGGMLVGSLLTGIVLSLLMSNAGSAWDNAKKYIEAGSLEGESKGSAAHSAAIVGDCIGDPFKDSTGPSMNVLIKLISIVALLLVPLL